LRRVDELWAGNLKSTLSLIAGLPAALEVPHEVIADALRQTEQQLAELTGIADQEEEWLPGDRPFSPAPILLDRRRDRVRFASTAFLEVRSAGSRSLSISPGHRSHSQRKRSPSFEERPCVSFWGPTTGFIVNYAPDFAVRFDVNGTPVERLNHAYRPEKVHSHHRQAGKSGRDRLKA
jgi:hypothetical protein